MFQTAKSDHEIGEKEGAIMKNSEINIQFLNLMCQSIYKTT